LKKNLLVAMSFIMTALLVFAVGCSSSTGTGGQSTEATEKEGPIFITMGTGTTGGTYYPLGGAMAKIWTDNIPNVHASVQSTGGTNQNIQLMADGQSEVGFTDTKYVLAYNGEGDWKGQPQTWLRGLLPLYPEPTNILVAKDSGIKTLEDMKGKRISIGAVGSGTESTSRELFSVLGMDVDKDIKAFMLGTGDTAKAFQDKQIDAAILVGSLGMSSIVELTSLNLVDFLDVPDETFEKIYEVNNTWVQFTIPANYYQNQPNPVNTYSAFNTLSCREDLPEDLAYQMVKTLFDHKEDLLAVRQTMENMTLENVEKIAIPIHPGALKYYKEKGAKLPPGN
jgi:TRAP transporter TAXI family solute receptor